MSRDTYSLTLDTARQRAGDGIRTHEMSAWKADALPLGDSRKATLILLAGWQVVKHLDRPRTIQ